MQAVMFDLETLDVLPSAVVLSLGAVKFDLQKLKVEDTDEKLSLRFDIDDQNKLNRTISESTLTWWSTQPADLQEEAFSDKGRTPLLEAVEKFRKFVWNVDTIWSQGSFDVNILENLFRQLEIPIPWQYWQVRDSRTIFSVIDGKIDRSNHHDALSDAIAQAEALQRALKKIKWTGSPL